MSSQNQPHISFTTVWQYWLGTAKLKNVFRLTLNTSNKLLLNFNKLSYLTDFN